MGYVIAFVIFIIIIVIYVICTWNTSLNEDYLYGYWTADDDEFCDISDIDSMMLFIGKPSASTISSTRERLCYLIIADDIYNGGITLTYTPGWSALSVSKYRIRANVTFDETYAIWPEYVNIDVDIRNGTLTIHNDETIYARLHKQHEITNSCVRLDCEADG